MDTLQKIIITGDAGRGKSALAEKMSKKLSIPHYSTDDYFYEEKFTRIRPREQALEQISKVYDDESWVVEGTTAWLLDPGMKKAEKIIYLKHNTLISQWFVLIKRYFQREKDTLKGTLQLMRHVFYKRYGLSYKKGKMTHAEFVEPYKEKVVVLSSFKEIDKFLESI